MAKHFRAGLRLRSFRRSIHHSNSVQSQLSHLNLHLLQPAYIPALGIGIWWTVFVLTLHTVWSISIRSHLSRPWCRIAPPRHGCEGTGLTVISILFALAAIATTAHANQALSISWHRRHSSASLRLCASWRLRQRFYCPRDRRPACLARSRIPGSWELRRWLPAPSFSSSRRHGDGAPSDLPASGPDNDRSDVGLISSRRMERPASAGTCRRSRPGLRVARFRPASRSRQRRNAASRIGNAIFAAGLIVAACRRSATDSIVR